MTKLRRSSGLLLHPTSLPGPHGIGEIGEAAYRWIDFMLQARQSVWQILPLGPTGYGNSPYQTTSVFAGNPLLLDLSRMAHEGYISPQALKEVPAFPDDHVEFEAVIDWKMPLLLNAYTEFDAKSSDAQRKAFNRFCAEYDDHWLDDYSLFMALKNHYGGNAWNTWSSELKLRNPGAMKEMQHQLKGEILAHKFLQFEFFRQWQELRKYANDRGIQIMGDIPIYVTYDSAEVWANQDRFCLDEEGNPTIVAGVPPDYFSETGQLWGNPIYNWEVMAEHGYQWWIERLRITLECVDLVRIDHFRGFESYWAVPFGEKTAENGEWIKGPEYDLFDVIMSELGEIPIIVEDLGVITPEVEALRDRYGFPGMKILQFAFGGDPEAPYLPHNYQRNCLVYTGSHDNDTTIGWYHTAPQHEREFCSKYLGGQPQNISWALIRLASASIAVLSVFPVQDVLSLDSSGRMNVPGQPHGNWGWRLHPNQLRDEHAAGLAEMGEIYGRAHKNPEDHDL